MAWRLRRGRGKFRRRGREVRCRGDGWPAGYSRVTSASWTAQFGRLPSRGASAEEADALGHQRGAEQDHQDGGELQANDEDDLFQLLGAGTGEAALGEKLAPGEEF